MEVPAFEAVGYKYVVEVVHDWSSGAARSQGALVVNAQRLAAAMAHGDYEHYGLADSPGQCLYFDYRVNGSLEVWYSNEEMDE